MNDTNKGSNFNGINDINAHPFTNTDLSLNVFGEKILKYKS